MWLVPCYEWLPKSATLRARGPITGPSGCVTVTIVHYSQPRLTVELSLVQDIPESDRVSKGGRQETVGGRVEQESLQAAILRLQTELRLQARLQRQALLRYTPYTYLDTHRHTDRQTSRPDSSGRPSSGILHTRTWAHRHTDHQTSRPDSTSRPSSGILHTRTWIKRIVRPAQSHSQSSYTPHQEYSQVHRQHHRGWYRTYWIELTIVLPLDRN